MITIGLTGGIASGKSTVSAMLRELGAHVIDADQVGHEVYEPGAPAWDRLVQAFGREIVGEDGKIDRKKLGPIVFADPAQLQTLNSIVHPLMRRMMEDRLEALRREGTTTVAVIEAAILIEGGWASLVDEIWVTAVPESVALERLVGRRGLTPEQAEARIRSQMGNEERKQYALRVIDTAGSLEDVHLQVNVLWADVLTRAKAKDMAR
ncbi:MAG: dephospho-CoA kinase [Dehalococcoidia bacterium]|nr:dephospho-CoA kinase [Dehalococcoidia bacterium]